MPLFKNLFGRGSADKSRVTAREGYSVALESLRQAHPAEADKAFLCCLYSSVFDSNVIIQDDGTCEAWHLDFFLTVSRHLYLVRLQKGKTRAKEVPWEQTGKRPVEYVAATYGMEAGEGTRLEPVPVPENWLDSPALITSIRDAVRPYESPRYGELSPVAVCLPAQHLRYLKEEKASRELSLPPAPPDCFAALCAPEELYEEDCCLVYVHAITGQILQEHVFRFPDLFNFGSSFHW
ncbi:MAG: hypothetical protein Kow0099_19840 [Candidatus Abyssubacteria bacterium]